jgi:Glycosidases
LYQVIGREKIGRGRYSRYTVMFSTTWPKEARSMYVVSTFTSLYPGRFELARFKDRGVLVLNLWDGLYPYWFSINGFSLYLDKDNNEKTLVKLVDSKYPIEASLAKVGVDSYSMASKNLRDWYDLVVHDERSPIFISRLGEFTVLRLWLPRDVIDEVLLEYRGSNEGEGGEVSMELVGRDEFKDYYEAWVRGCVRSYIFKLRDGSKMLPFGRDGVGDGNPITPTVACNSSEIPWWVGATYYMIFVDSFERAIEVKDVELIKVYEPREPGYYGGDLVGIARRISYIGELGFNAIYLTPIYVSASYHRYDVIDHFQVDPLIGGGEAFKELLKELKLRGLRLVLDIVVHHTSLCHKAFRELLEGGVNDMYKLLEHVRSVDESVVRTLREFISRGCRGKMVLEQGFKPFYESFAGTGYMPKLDHSKLRVRSYVKRLLTYWLGKGVDGFRFDVGHAVPDSFMKEYYDYVKMLKKDAIIISEVTIGVDNYPLGISMDSATNYDLRDHLIKFLIQREINAFQMEGFLARQYSRIPITSSLSLVNLAGSHDTPRIKTIATKCYPACVKKLYFLLFILPGAPAIYYGDEVGMEGLGDPDCRRPMVWDERRWDKDLLNYIRELLELRRRLKALRYGSFKVKALDDYTITVYRGYEEEHVLGVVSLSDDRWVKLDPGIISEVLIGSMDSKGLTLDGGIALLTLSPPLKGEAPL